jgi:hypothetical protein
LVLEGVKLPVSVPANNAEDDDMSDGAGSGGDDLFEGDWSMEEEKEKGKKKKKNSAQKKEDQ